MEKLIVKVSKIFLVSFLCFFSLSNTCWGQNERVQTFNEICKYYQEVPLPVNDIILLKKDKVIDSKLMNRLLFDLQDDRAKHYVKDTLYRITSYGRISEEQFDFNTFKRINGERIRYDTAFEINVYALGKIEFENDHVGLITRVVGFMTDYVDIHLFEKSSGIHKSLISAFEAAHARNGFPKEGYEAVYNTSTITEEKQIKWNQERYGVTTERIFDISPDGYFRVIYQKQEGEFEY